VVRFEALPEHGIVLEVMLYLAHGVLQGGTVPPTFLELVLAFVDGASRSATYRIHERWVAFAKVNLEKEKENFENEFKNNFLSRVRCSRRNDRYSIFRAHVDPMSIKL